MGDKQAALDRLKDQIRESETITDRDRENLLAFDDRMALLRSDYSVSRREKHLRACAIMAGQAKQYDPEELPEVELSAALDSRDATEALVRWINEYRSDSEETNKDYRVALRAFGKHVTEGDEPPDAISWVSATYSNTYQPKPDPGDMLDWDEHVVPMVEDPKTNTRDAALMAVAWDAGARAGELLSVTIGDIADRPEGVYLTVDGKTGQRSIMLLPSVPYLNRWLDEHPGDRDATAPLWCKQDVAEPLSDQYVWQMLRRTAKRVGVTKTVNLTNFRKSRASDLASRGMNQALLEDRFGWTQGSKHAGRYISIFSTAAEDEFRRLHGQDVAEDTPEPLSPITCPRCSQESPRHKAYCGNCNHPLTSDAVAEAEEARTHGFVLTAGDDEIPDADREYITNHLQTLIFGSVKDRVAKYNQALPPEWELVKASDAEPQDD